MHSNNTENCSRNLDNMPEVGYYILHMAVQATFSLLFITLITPNYYYAAAESPYVRCTAGDLNVVVSSPHGGYQKPGSIPDRTEGCLQRGSCVYTHDCGQTSDQ